MYSYSKTLSYSSALFIFLFSMGVYADTQYVSDQLEITMRTGPAVKNKINQMLKSGDQLTVLQQPTLVTYQNLVMMCRCHHLE